MNSILADKQVVVYDRGGLFTHVAEMLASYCQSYPVMYFTEWREAFPHSHRRMPGVGLDGIERIDDFFEHVGAADLIVFPDVGDGYLQEYLRSQGNLVWGSGLGDRIESDKVGFCQWLASNPDLEATDMWLIEGLDALEDFLSDPEHEDVWLKANDRGDLETYHHKNWGLTEQWFRELDHKIGPNRDLIQVVAQKPIPADDEVGYDGYMIDGEFPATGVIGWEAKDTMYLGKVVKELPVSVATVNAIMGARCSTLGYRGAFSTEVREAGDGKFYFIDPTHRFGSPPSECMVKWYKNWDEIIYYGAAGRLIEPQPIAQYGAEVILRSIIKQRFLPVQFPEYLRPNVSLHQHCRIDNTDYIAPREHEEFGAAIGFGDTPEEALEAAVSVADQVEAQELKFDRNAQEELLDIVNNYANKGA